MNTWHPIPNYGIHIAIEPMMGIVFIETSLHESLSSREHHVASSTNHSDTYK